MPLLQFAQPTEQIIAEFRAAGAEFVAAMKLQDGQSRSARDEIAAKVEAPGRV